MTLINFIGCHPLNYNLLHVGTVAIGNESKVVRERGTSSLEHFLESISIQLSNPMVKFYNLKSKWEDETAMLSSTTAISMHPAYQQIIGMGPVAIPLILSEMKNNPGHWFWALKSITGEDPVLPEQRGRIKEMTEAWLSWGMEQGYPLYE